MPARQMSWFHLIVSTALTATVAVTGYVFREARDLALKVNTLEATRMELVYKREFVDLLRANVMPAPETLRRLDQLSTQLDQCCPRSGRRETP